MESASSPASALATQNPGWIVLAHLLRPQGRKGEILADLLTDFPERFDDAPRVFLAPPAFSGPESDTRPVIVSGAWLPVGKNRGRIVLHFEGIDSITLAETLSGLDVIVPATERMELEEDANYVSDLVGCTLYDHATPAAPFAVGLVSDVEFATTPNGSRRLDDAAPLLTVETSEGEEILIPFVKEFLISIDVSAKRIDMRLPAGLVEVNRP